MISILRTWLDKIFGIPAETPVAPTPNVIQPIEVVDMSKNRREDITKLYQELLKREPDSGGLDHWTASSLSIDEIRQEFLNCEEYKNLQANQADASRKEAIANLYRELLKREPDEGGLNFWSQGPLSLDQVREEFLKSEEYKNLQQAPVAAAAPVKKAPAKAATKAAPKASTKAEAKPPAKKPVKKK